jgi:ATP-dependent DNA ligase
MVSIVETKLVTCKDDVITHFEEILSRNGEGTILKSYDGKWKNGKPVTSIKLKKEIELDLKIVGFNMGTGKNVNVVSSLNCESGEGLLKTSPTGISEEDMLDITQRQEELLGTIVAVKCSGISKDSNGNYSLLHPVYKGLRIGEKSIADTLAECIEINKSSQFQ